MVVAAQVILGTLIGATYGCHVLLSASLADVALLHLVNNAVALYGFGSAALSAQDLFPLLWCLVLYVALLRHLSSRLPGHGR